MISHFLRSTVLNITAATLPSAALFVTSAIGYPMWASGPTTLHRAIGLAILAAGTILFAWAISPTPLTDYAE